MGWSTPVMAVPARGRRPSNCLLNLSLCASIVAHSTNHTSEQATTSTLSQLFCGSRLFPNVQQLCSGLPSSQACSRPSSSLSNNQNILQIHNDRNYALAFILLSSLHSTTFAIYWSGHADVLPEGLFHFQNQFLRWNLESKPVDLNTMNPIIQTIFFFIFKGVRAILDLIVLWLCDS